MSNRGDETETREYRNPPKFCSTSQVHVSHIGYVWSCVRECSACQQCKSPSNDNTLKGLSMN